MAAFAGAGRWRMCPQSLWKNNGRGPLPSLGESPNLQLLAFLQNLPEFSGEVVNRAEHHPTARVVLVV